MRIYIFKIIKKPGESRTICPSIYLIKIVQKKKRTYFTIASSVLPRPTGLRVEIQYWTSNHQRNSIDLYFIDCSIWIQYSHELNDHQDELLKNHTWKYLDLKHVLLQIDYVYNASVQMFGIDPPKETSFIIWFKNYL